MGCGAFEFVEPCVPHTGCLFGTSFPGIFFLGGIVWLDAGTSVPNPLQRVFVYGPLIAGRFLFVPLKKLKVESLSLTGLPTLPFFASRSFFWFFREPMSHRALLNHEV